MRPISYGLPISNVKFQLFKGFGNDYDFFTHCIGKTRFIVSVRIRIVGEQNY